MPLSPSQAFRNATRRVRDESLGSWKPKFMSKTSRKGKEGSHKRAEEAAEL